MSVGFCCGDLACLDFRLSVGAFFFFVRVGLGGVLGMLLVVV